MPDIKSPRTWLGMLDMQEITHSELLKVGGRYDALSLDGLTENDVRLLYGFMVRLRMCEEQLQEEYHPADEMRCPVHFCIGQEAVPAALSLILCSSDYLFSHHRSHGYFLAKCGEMKTLFAELYGRSTGANGGIAGSQDISMHTAKFYSGAILAGAVAIATGAAMGIQLQGSDSVVAVGFGEGAGDEGVFWEAVSFAALRQMPVIFICENNRYATFSEHLKRQSRDNISLKAEAFGVMSSTVFGNDVAAVYRALQEAHGHAKCGGGPVLVQTYTYRSCSHVGPEDDSWIGYRPTPELEYWKTNCPINLLEEKMITNSMLNQTSKSELVRQFDAEIQEAFKYAKSSPLPSEVNWSWLNANPSSPLADVLLGEIDVTSFDEGQKNTLPAPY